MFVNKIEKKGEKWEKNYIMNEQLLSHIYGKLM